MRPASGCTRPARMRSSVVLPQPLGPSRQTSSPRPTVRSIPRSTSVAPKRLEMSVSSTSGASMPGAATGGPAQEPMRARATEPWRASAPGERPVPFLHPCGPLLDHRLAIKLEQMVELHTPGKLGIESDGAIGGHQTGARHEVLLHVLPERVVDELEGRAGEV